MQAVLAIRSTTRDIQQVECRLFLNSFIRESSYGLRKAGEDYDGENYSYCFFFFYALEIESNTEVNPLLTHNASLTSVNNK